MSVQPLELPASEAGTPWIEVDGRLVYVEQSGRGEPLVLIHGFAASSYSWRKVMPDLARHYRVVALDLYGFGWTERPEDRACYTRDGQVALVLGVMNALSLDSAHIIGHSYGGAVTMALAADHPERVRSMTLVDSAAIDYPLTRRRWFAHSRVLSWMFVRGLALRTSIVERAFERAYHDDNLVTPELVGAYLERLRIEGVTHTYRALSLPPPREQRPREIRYEELAVPTLVVWGAEDRLIELEVGRYHAELITDSRFVVIEDAGHSPMEEKPDEFLQRVEDFLDQLRDEAPTPISAGN